mgnify:CR=1 FL=1
MPQVKTKGKTAVKATGAKATGFVTDFVNFVRQQGVVGLAVGLAIGAAAGGTVKVIVENFINPLVALLTQGIDLNQLSWTVKLKNGEAVFGWGAILSSIITLLATAFVIFWLVHIAKLDKLDKKKS